MDKNIFIVLLSSMMISCHHSKTNSRFDSAYDDPNNVVPGVTQQTESGDSVIPQSVLNYEKSEATKEYNNSVENEFQKLIAILPEYNDEFENEKALWLKYQEAVYKVANSEYHGSSSPMFVADVLDLGIKQREASFHNLYLYTQGKTIAKKRTTFTAQMIDDAYVAFINAVGQDEYVENKTEYQASLREEQKCWIEWMAYRKTVSQQLTEEYRLVYDDCTNLVMREKLFQMKNQNQALGVCGVEVMNCVLPDDCSDKALLDYPGFDVVWAKHCENTNWYPSF